MTRPFDVFDHDCPSRGIVDDVVDRWSALVLVALIDSPHRFSETARTVGGISDRMLTRTLATLTADGLVTRFAPRLDVARFLQMVCEDTLEKEMWRELFSVEQIAYASAEGARIAASLPATALTLLRRNRSTDRDDEADSKDGTSTDESSIAPFGVIAVAAALVTQMPGVEPDIGWNLFTAALATAAAAATMGLAQLGLRG